ncbi:FAD-linked oxidoreductase [Mollisia scopiformis]|uniref:Proline dehydrogenase n=1 Tax=Mollisia scopiformis TaxID=149040 RepID=A0A194XW25_MOLSC|nr:FAD-linked oxidoreductase [Mollisia scopiformis]KUJ24433.1 FAD-linked oxidoreductase [Mollisia scopiformis]
MKATPLSILPLSSIVRSLAITSISSSTLLLPPSLYIMAKLAHTNLPILSPDTNPVLQHFLKRTFYRQFCAGENSSEVHKTASNLRSLGFSGVILAYAKEVVLSESQHASLESCGESSAAEQCIREEIIPWANGTMETVKMTRPGDFVALKFTGAGSQALFDLSQETGPSEALREAIDGICSLAEARGVKLLFDAEQAAVQKGIDRWTLQYMQRYNCKTPGHATVYGTYQAYLKATPKVLAGHMKAAREGGFTLGVKLVRGAYLGSDPRHLIHDTKADTDRAYDGIAESLCRRSYGPILQAVDSEKKFPEVNVVLAGHNIHSVRKVKALRQQQKERGEQQIELVYAQLQGMADEVSCELVQAGLSEKREKAELDAPKVYKYLVWGTTGECMKYLLRRAQENKDAVQRTRDGRDAMANELWRRMRQTVGLGA